MQSIIFEKPISEAADLRLLGLNFPGGDDLCIHRGGLFPGLERPLPGSAVAPKAERCALLLLVAAAVRSAAGLAADHV